MNVDFNQYMEEKWSSLWWGSWHNLLWVRLDLELSWIKPKVLESKWTSPHFISVSVMLESLFGISIVIIVIFYSIFLFENVLK